MPETESHSLRFLSLLWTTLNNRYIGSSWYIISYGFDQVLIALNDIDVTKKGDGPDSICSTFLCALHVLCAFELAYSLCCMLNLSLHGGIFRC